MFSSVKDLGRVKIKEPKNVLQRLWDLLYIYIEHINALHIHEDAYVMEPAASAFTASLHNTPLKAPGP